MAAGITQNCLPPQERARPGGDGRGGILCLPTGRGADEKPPSCRRAMRSGPDWAYSRLRRPRTGPPPTSRPKSRIRRGHRAKLGKIAQPLRAALTGRSVRRRIRRVHALGRAETIARLKDQRLTMLSLSVHPPLWQPSYCMWRPLWCIAIWRCDAME